MGTQFGPGVMYILSQLMQRRLAEATAGQSGERAERPEPSAEQGPDLTETAAEKAENDFFTSDETGAVWHKETNLELLKSFCREGYAQAARHGHFIIGNSQAGSYIGIPGRFLIEDQPAGGRTGFTLWQPLRGGETLYQGLDNMDEETAKQIYGYWIGALDSKTLEISEV